MAEERDCNQEWIDQMVEKQHEALAEKTISPEEIEALVRPVYSEDDLGASIAYCPLCHCEIANWEGRLQPHAPYCLAEPLLVAAQTLSALSPAALAEKV